MIFISQKWRRALKGESPSIVTTVLEGPNFAQPKMTLEAKIQQLWVEDPT